MCVLELLLPTETFHFLRQFHFVNVIYSVVFKNAKYAYRLRLIAAAISLESVFVPQKAAGNRANLHSDNTQT